MLQNERIDISKGTDFNKSELILETFILVLMISGTKAHRKNLMF